MRTFPNIQPTYTSSFKRTCRVLRSEFGDGYVQRAADGINNIGLTLDLVWEGLTSTQADRIDEFLQDHAGVTPFAMALPRTTEKLRWVCSEWNYVWVEGELATITATFEQDFGLA